MPNIIISDETKRLIDAQALPGFDVREIATRLPDGRWRVPVDLEERARIDLERLPGEDVDAAVSRLVRPALDYKPN